MGVNPCQHIIHMYKIFVYLYTADEQINQLAIGFMVNPSLCVNKGLIKKFIMI